MIPKGEKMNQKIYIVTVEKKNFFDHNPYERKTFYSDQEAMEKACKFRKKYGKYTQTNDPAGLKYMISIMILEEEYTPDGHIPAPVRYLNRGGYISEYCENWLANELDNEYEKYTVASAWWDGGWRPNDKQDLLNTYDITEDDVDMIIEIFKEYEENERTKLTEEEA